MIRSIIPLFAMTLVAVLPAQTKHIHGFVEKQVVYSGGSYEDEVFRYRLRSPSKIAVRASSKTQNGLVACHIHLKPGVLTQVILHGLQRLRITVDQVDRRFGG